MAQGPRLDLRQSQSLVMTPQLQQAIRLLALSNLEIESFIAEEIDKNPLLESGGEDERPEPVEVSPAETAREESGFDEVEPETVDELVVRGEGAAEAPLDMDLNDENIHQDSAADRGLDGALGLDGIGGGGEGEGPDFDGFASGGASLHEHLLAQAGERLGGSDLAIATQIIEQIEETGYFTGATLDIARRLGVPLQQVEQVLAIVQSFDPPGVGARSLSECLALQAKDADRYD